MRSGRSATRFTEDITANDTFPQIGRDFDSEFVVTGPGGRTTAMQIGGPFLTDGADMTIMFDVDVDGEPSHVRRRPRSGRHRAAPIRAMR